MHTHVGVQCNIPLVLNTTLASLASFNNSCLQQKAPTNPEQHQAPSPLLLWNEQGVRSITVHPDEQARVHKHVCTYVYRIIPIDDVGITGVMKSGDELDCRGHGLKHGQQARSGMCHARNIPNFE